MVGETDQKDKAESRKVGIILLVLVAVLLAAVALIIPMAAEFAAVHFEPGLGLKSAAVIAFFVSIVVMLVFAFAAGDGLIGELQYILSAFFLFFLIFWLMLAWIF